MNRAWNVKVLLVELPKLVCWSKLISALPLQKLYNWYIYIYLYYGAL